MKHLMTATALSAGLLTASTSQSEPYVGEIRFFAFDYCPKDWVPANGQLLNPYYNEALFSLLGTMYGGDGRNDFALPNLQGRTVNGIGPDHQIGSVASGDGSGEGAESLTVTACIATYNARWPNRPTN